MARVAGFKISISLMTIITMVLLTFSCSKQESPTIETGEVRSAQEIERLEACSHVNFNHGVLLHQNALLLFKCTKWDLEFPHMYNAMKSIQRDSWDHLMKPIDQSFIENHTRRDRFFKNIRELDSKNGLDDLSYVIVALNETNFFDSTKAMFKCIENPSDVICLERSGRIPQKRSLKNIIKLIDVNPETINRASGLVRQLVNTLGERQDEVRSEINKFRANPLFVPLRLKLVDAFAQKIKSGLSDEDRKFLSKVLLTGSSNSPDPWIYQWIQGIKMNRQTFRDLLEYPILINPEFTSEFRGVKKIYDSQFSCSFKNSSTMNEVLTFDFKDYIGQTVDIIQKANMREYFNFASEGIVSMKLSTEICTELEKNKFGINLIRTLSRFSHFMSDRNRYDLTRFLLSQTTTKSDPNSSFAENLYLADIVTGNLFSTINALNTEITSSTREFYPLVFDVLKDLPSESFTDLGQLIDSATVEENDLKMKAVADYWSFFTDEEKNFIFNFVDRHFDKETNFVLLFDFYTKFLDDFQEVQPLLKESWMGSDNNVEMSYLTLQDFFYNLSGKETLLDFKKFFSRDQILKVLEVISNGQKINTSAKLALSEQSSDDYVRQARSERYQFKVVYNPGSVQYYDADVVLACMKDFSNVENGFYELIRRMPEACVQISNENIAFRLYGWLNSIEKNYLTFKKNPSPADSLLNDRGLMSPYMLNSVIATTKILDTLLGPVGSRVPTSGGVDYLFSSLKHHLIEKKVAPVIEKNLLLASQFLEIMPEDNIPYRNALLKKFSQPDNFSKTNDVLGNLSSLSTQYAEWIKNGKLARAQSRSLGTYDPNSECEKVVNQVVAPNPCPGKDVIKKHTNGILNYLTKTWDPSLGSPLSQLLKALKPDEGLMIPLNGKNTKKYRMSLKETFQYFYNASDRSMKINNVDMLFVDENYNRTYQNVTTLERIETVIREVRFGNNYLGVAFLNGIVHAEDYSKEAISRRQMLSRCLKIPVIRCARSMTKDDLRMGRNSLEAFDSLIDINNGRGLEPRLKFGDFLSTFEQTLVGSSAKKAQIVQLFPLSDVLLLQHNGRLLGEMTMMTSWSNVARVIRDRVGRTRADFDKFVNSEDFQRVDRALLYGFELPRTAQSAEKLIRKFQMIPEGEKQNLTDETIDWIASLNYDQTRLVEDTIARFMVVASYLGPPSHVFKSTNYQDLDSRYKENNLFQSFLALEKLIDHWPTLKNYFPKDATLIDALKPINSFLVFLTEKLNSSDDPEKNIAYKVLNDIFVILEATLFDRVDIQKPELNGLDILLGALKKPNLVSSSFLVMREDYRLLDHFHENKGQWFESFALNIDRIIDSKKVDLTPIRDYLNFTTKPVVCLSGQKKDCPTNYHYDEPSNLVKFLSVKNVEGQSHFMTMTKKVLSENFDQLTDMLNDLLPAIKIKDQRPPLIN